MAVEMFYVDNVKPVSPPPRTPESAVCIAEEQMEMIRGSEPPASREKDVTCAQISFLV